MDWLWKAVICTLVIVIVTGLVILITNPTRPTPILIRNAYEETDRQVSIFGAVKSPGIYKYTGRIRLSDVVEFAGGLSENADRQNADLSKWVSDGENIIIPTAGPYQPTLTLSVREKERIDINTADKELLMSLPGIGEKRANDIIMLREKKGKFKRVEEILEIPGIGEKLLESIYDRLIVE